MQSNINLKYNDLTSAILCVIRGNNIGKSIVAVIGCRILGMPQEVEVDVMQMIKGPITSHAWSADGSSM